MKFLTTISLLMFLAGTAHAGTNSNCASQNKGDRNQVKNDYASFAANTLGVKRGTKRTKKLKGRR